MPTREPIVDTVVPVDAPKPIPERIAITREKPKTKPQPQQNGNQQPTGETAQAAESATTEESVKLSPQVSAIARKEQAIRQRELQLKQQEKELQDKLARAEQFDQLQAKLKEKDFSAAEQLGLTYEEYTQWLLQKQQGDDPTLKLINELQDEVKSLKQRNEEKIEQDFELTKQAYQDEIKKLVDENPDFSSIKELKLQDAVLQVILDAWEQDGEELSVEEACKDIEAHLVEQAKKFSSLPKVKPAEQETKQPLPPPRKRTLTNDMAPTGNTAKTKVDLHRLSDAERYAEARRRVEARKQQGNR